MALCSPPHLHSHIIGSCKRDKVDVILQATVNGTITCSQKTKKLAAHYKQNQRKPSSIPPVHLVSVRVNKYSERMIVEAAQVHILPVSKQPGDQRDGKGKDIKAILLNPQAFVLVHLELKICGVSILNNSAILSKKKPAQQWLCCSINVPACM